MATLSYNAGCSDLPMIYSDLPSILDKVAEECPEKPAHIFRFLKDPVGDKSELTRTVITFQQLADRSFSVAASLLKLGIKPGETIAILGGNTPQWLYMDYGCLRIKVLMIRIPRNFLREETLVRTLAKYDCRVLVVDGAGAEQLGSFIATFVGGKLSTEKQEQLKSLKEILILDKNPTGSEFPKLRTVDELSMCASGRDKVSVVQATIDPEEIAIILPTSGSTGEPKFVAYTHFSCINGQKSSHVIFHLDEPDSVYFNDRPFGWIGGFVYIPILYRIPMIYMDNRATFGGDAFNLVYKVMKEERVTGALLLPYILFDAMKASESGTHAPESLKYVITGGERLPTSLMEFACKEFYSLALGYGSTECMISCRGIVSAHGENTGSLTKMGCYPRFEVKVTDSNAKVVARGQPGQLWVRSLFGMDGYLRDPEMTRKVKSPDGWINSGDIGAMTEDGLIEIVGRTKDIISRGGTKIYPKFIEEILIRCPGIQKAMVVGVPDPRLFQELCACIILQPGQEPNEADIRAFYQSKMLGGSCSPRYYLFMEDFPKGNTGKFDRITLTATASVKLGLLTE